METAPPVRLPPSRRQFGETFFATKLEYGLADRSLGTQLRRLGGRRRGRTEVK